MTKCIAYFYVVLSSVAFLLLKQNKTFPAKWHLTYLLNNNI